MTSLTVIETSGTNNLTSIEIAELTGKRHANVMRDIAAMFDQLKIESVKFQNAYLDSKGEYRACYSLPPREVKILITGYDVVRRAKVIDRLEQLEANIMPQDLPTALRAYADQLEQKAKLQLQLQVTEVKVKALEITLDVAELHASVKKMESHYSRKFPWPPLKDYSMEHGYGMPKVFDQNYERGVNSYHNDVWMAVYNVSTKWK